MSRMLHHEPEDDPAYQAGHSARERGASRLACPYGLHDMLRHSLWLAGWHDADMELSA
ncbi:ribosome modulation factor [Pseudomonas sp. SP16.1]|uniref:ribosome modulation factor n=1 Tax=Pseudomonas sp. SP16.1 TaxID=3458854 RepID=UPI0040460049